MRGLGAMDALSGAAYVRFVREGRVQGELYDLGDYPGLMPGVGQVRGEVYEILSPTIWELLDPFEDYLPEDESRSLYLRRALPLVGGTEYAWTYLYNRPVTGCRKIRNGDWRGHWIEKCRRAG